MGCHFSSRLTATLNLCLIYFRITRALAILLEHMNKKFEINWTKIKGGCQSGSKVVTHNSKNDLPLASHVRPQCLTMDFLFLTCTYEVSSTILTGTRTSDGIHIWKNCNLFQKSCGHFFSFCQLGFETRLGPRLGHMSRLFYEFLCNEKYIKQWHFVQYFTRRNNLLNGKIV